MYVDWSSGAKSQYNMLHSSLQSEVDGLIETIKTFPESGKDYGSYRAMAFNNYQVQYKVSGGTVHILDIPHIK